MAIAVLGSGAWGTALAVTLSINSPDEQIFLWGRNNHYSKNINVKLPKNLIFTTDLISTVQKFKNLIIAVPSNGFKNVIQQIKPYLNQHMIAWATKGMDTETNQFFSQIVLNSLGENQPIAILSGPSFAQEVIDQLPTAVVLAFRSKDQLFAEQLVKKLHSKNFNIYLSYDLIGVQLGGIFKNVLAVATGICDGIGFGANTRSALITRGVAELLKLAEKLGAESKTIIGLSGIGDIVLTCCNNQSRNRKFGLLLAKGITVEQAKMEIGQAIEALDNIESLYNLAVNYKVNMPIVAAVWKILNQQLHVNQAIDFLLSNEPQLEN